jgi:hypothetical protein
MSAQAGDVDRGSNPQSQKRQQEQRGQRAESQRRHKLVELQLQLDERTSQARGSSNGAATKGR